jgi:hypothetical protein
LSLRRTLLGVLLHVEGHGDAGADRGLARRDGHISAKGMCRGHFHVTAGVAPAVAVLRNRAHKAHFGAGSLGERLGAGASVFDGELTQLLHRGFAKRVADAEMNALDASVFAKVTHDVSGLIDAADADSQRVGGGVAGDRIRLRMGLRINIKRGGRNVIRGDLVRGGEGIQNGLGLLGVLLDRFLHARGRGGLRGQIRLRIDGHDDGGHIRRNRHFAPAGNRNAAIPNLVFRNHRNAHTEQTNQAENRCLHHKLL